MIAPVGAKLIRNKEITKKWNKFSTPKHLCFKCGIQGSDENNNDNNNIESNNNGNNNK